MFQKGFLGLYERGMWPQNDKDVWVVGVEPQNPTCRKCGTFRGYISNNEYWDVAAQVQSYEKRKKSESLVRQRGRGSHMPRGRGK